MPRWIDEWMPGAGPAGGTEPGAHPGERLGLPAQGVGSVAGFGRRLAGITVDWLLAYLITGLLADPQDPTFGFVVLAIWFALTALPVALFSTSAGMVIVGIRVATVGPEAVVGVPRAVIRTLLIALIIPPLIRDDDSRGWHDLASRTVVVRARA